MKKILLVLLIPVLFYGCHSSKELDAVEVLSIKKTTDALITNWHAAASNANYQNYFGALDSLSVFIGTDASENWTKAQFAAFSKPYFDQGKAWDFKTLERNMYLNTTGNVVWFDELLSTWMGTCRGSGVLEKTKETWKIKHYVLSVEVPNDAVQAVIEVKKKSDAIFLSNFKPLK
jgi:hypothetical protein